MSPKLKHPYHWSKLTLNQPIQTKSTAKDTIVGASNQPIIDRLNEWGDDLANTFLQPYLGVFDYGGYLEGYEDPDYDDDNLY